jgi:hypothetical protein
MSHDRQIASASGARHDCLDVLYRGHSGILDANSELGSSLPHGKLGSELQVPRADAARLLNGAARSGLIDVRTGSLDGSRSCAVRPPMLADALVAEQAFSAPVPGLDLRGLADQWPEHAAELARAVITAAVHGAVNAQPLAREHLDQAMDNTEIPSQVKTSLCLEFTRLDRSATEHVTRIARQAFGQLASGGTDARLDAEGIVAIVGRGTWLYQLDTAVDLLLDMTPKPVRASAATTSRRCRRRAPAATPAGGGRISPLGACFVACPHP